MALENEHAACFLIDKVGGVAFRGTYMAPRREHVSFFIKSETGTIIMNFPLLEAWHRSEVFLYQTIASRRVG